MGFEESRAVQDEAPKIFLSYCHRDNRPISRAEKSPGWVDVFHEELQAHLSLRGLGQKSVFRDTDGISRGQLLTPSIQRALDQVAIFLMLESNHFYGSEWCPGELDHFLNRYPTLRVGEFSRVAQAVFFPPDEVHRRVELADTLYAPLYRQSKGEPMVYSLLQDDQRAEFDESVQWLASGLIKIWKAHLAGSELPSGPSLYLAPAPRELKQQRERVHKELTAVGLRVLEVLSPDHVESGSLSVHLLSPEIDEVQLSPIKKALSLNLRPWVWTESGETSKLCGLRCAILKTRSLDVFIKDVIDEIHGSLKETVEPDPGKVYIHHNEADRTSMERLGDWLEDQNFTTVIQPDQMPHCGSDLVLFDQAGPEWVNSQVSWLHRERNRPVVYVCGDLSDGVKRFYVNSLAAEVIKEKPAFPPEKLVKWAAQMRAS